MVNYWLRNRLLLSIAFVIATVLVISLAFVSPYMQDQASEYNAHSMYKNTTIDFIAPDPSFAQVDELSDNHGIERVFPYYATKSELSVKGKIRSTQVLLSDRLENMDLTMYNDARLIQRADIAYDDPIYVDWQFCQDTGANIGDEVTIPLGDWTAKYTIAAIYETNDLHDGGAILAPISTAQRDAIAQNARNKGYSGMYISASNYAECRTYLTTDYRPLGRLKDRNLFESDESYDIHYHAIMDSGFANEITDFRLRETGLTTDHNNSLLWIGAAVAFVLFMTYGMLMLWRGSERGYFINHSIPAGRDVKPYYICSFISETVLFVALFYLSLQVMARAGNQYIPEGIIDGKFIIIPFAVVAAEIAVFFISLRSLRRRKASSTDS